MKVTIILLVLCAVLYASAIGGSSGSTKCLTSAGYSWCAFEGKCVRPWELAKEKGLEMTEGNIEQYCAVKKVGGNADSNGCVKSAGYSWCQKESQCVRPWELATTKQISIKSESDFQNYCNNNSTTNNNKVGNDKDSNGCLGSAGYSWCKKENKCVKAWELLKSLNLESTVISFQSYCSDCLASAGYSFCYAQQKCIRPWELAKQLAIDATPESIQSYCSQSPVSKTRNIGGSDSTHGCIAGAGYSWCAKESQCVRPWEVASTQQLDNTPEAFEEYCNENQIHITGPLMPSPGAPQNLPDSSAGNTVGGESDNHGCIAGAGYSWCAKESKCVRPWELAKEKNISGMTAESFTAYCSSQ